jgi:hypothetical protein
LYLVIIFVSSTYYIPSGFISGDAMIENEPQPILLEKSPSLINHAELHQKVSLKATDMSTLRICKWAHYKLFSVYYLLLTQVLFLLLFRLLGDLLAFHLAAS